MKNCRLLGGVAAAALLLLTSCLGDNNSTASLNMVPGVVRFDMTSLKILVDSKAGTISAKEFEKYSENDCLIVNFSYDSQNQVSDKYTTVTLNGEPAKVDKGQTFRSMTDTTVLKTDEVPLITSVEKSFGQIFAYLNGFLFLPSGIKAPTDQKTTWELSYDPKVPAVEINGKRVYSLFLRATIRTAGEDDVKEILSANAFEAKHFFETVNAIEQGKSSDRYSIQIYYINKINEKDRKEFTWAACEPIEFAVEKKK